VPPAGGAQLALDVASAVNDAMERAQQRDVHSAAGGEAPAPADGGIALGELVPAREPPHHGAGGEPGAAQLAEDAVASGHRGDVEIARASEPVHRLRPRPHPAADSRDLRERLGVDERLGVVHRLRAPAATRPSQSPTAMA
jgi:hypothetical protein